jgi:formylglycine-generating enzyme required for sulfatase activity
LLVVLANAVAAANTIAVDIALSTVGDPGNLPDPTTGYGAVPYTYAIGTYDVTLSQYTTFLNAVASSGDSYGLYTLGMASDLPTSGIIQTSRSGTYSYTLKGDANGNFPVFDVTWGDAARFVNWLANGQPTGPEGPGTTETGTYDINRGTSDAALMAVTRSATATWVLPNTNEWYKAAYYVGGSTNAGYWRYPTQSNDIPSNLLSATGTNSANFDTVDNGPPNYGATDHINYLTPVGAFAASPGPYGTYDQGGDVWQWEETAIDNSSRETRGGSYAGGYAGLESSLAVDSPPALSDSSVGFRVAYVPEPTTAAMLIAAALTGFFLVKRRRSLNENRCET